jgi:preprotein translocase subunit SecF
MLRIFHNTNYDFIKPWRIAVGFTLAFYLAGAIAMIVHRGLNYSIEFTGGTLIQLEFQQPPNASDIRSTVEASGFPGAEIQQFGSNREFTVRAAGEAATGAASQANVSNVASRIEAGLQQRFGANAPRIVRTEIIGPRVGQELRSNALKALFISLLVTLAFLAYRYDWRFGVAAVIATAHNLAATLAFMSLMNLEVSLTVVAALLTVIGYSLNDTIIIFDRVRENLRKARPEALPLVLNRAINETLPRSVLTHATVALAILALLLFAGEVIRPFSWIMLFGVVTATFSSIYIAGQVLLWIEHRWPRQRPGAMTPSSAGDAKRAAPVRTAASVR